MSLPRYPEYKDSGVEWLGELPAHWSVARLKQVADVRLSNVDKHSVETQPAVRLCNYVDVYKNDRITSVMEFMQATASEEQIARLSLLAGDVIITKDSEVPSDIGVPALVDETIPDLVCGYHLALIRPTHAVGGFLRYLFKSDYVKAVFEVEATGMTRYALGKYSIENLAHLAPPIEEQQTIAAFLDRETGKIDALIAEQQRLVELLAEKRQAVISHAVTKGLNPNAPMKKSGIEWLGDVPEHWTVTSIRRAVRRIEQGWSPDCFSRPAEPDEWGVVKSGCVNRGVFVEQENKALPETLIPIPEFEIHSGDVLMSRASGSPELVGSTAYITTTRPKLMLSDKIFRIHPEPSLDRKFFVAVFNSRVMRSQIERAISGAEGLANNLPQSSMKGFFCAIPSIDEQTIIVCFLSSETAKFDALTSEANRAIALLQERRSALISAAVTGKIDVRGRA